MKSLALVLGLSLATLSTAAWPLPALGQESSRSLTRSMLKFGQWTVETHAPTGFEFVLDDYPSLRDLSLQSDETQVTQLAFDRSTGSYSLALVRTLKLREAEGRNIELRITVEPTARRARASLIRPFEESSTLPFTTRYAGDLDLNVGAAALIREVGRDLATLAAQNVFDFTFIRYNVECRLTKSTGCTLNLHALAAALDSAIVAQANTAPVSPEASLALGANSVQFEGLPDGARLEVAITLTTPRAGTRHCFFARTRAPACSVDEDGNTVVSDEQYFGAASGITFDESDPSSPRLKTEAGHRGEHRIGVVAWGESLWPRVVTVALEVR